MDLDPLADLAARMRQQRARLDDLIATIPGVVWEAQGPPDSDQRIDFVSDYAVAMLGYDLREWLATPGFWLSLVHVEDRPRVAQELMAVYDGGGMGKIDCRWVAHDGHVLWVETRCVVVTDGAGRPVALQGVTLDDSERREAEEGLRQRIEELADLTTALESKNQELDQFAYITSHDLKAPLRGIANLSRWIEEDLGANLTDEIAQQMNLLRGRVNRMESMIEGILEYSRIGRTAAKREQVDVTELLAESVDLLAPPPGYTVEIQSGMPTLETDRLRLQQVFMNLIGNAIKHHGGTEGKVVVSVRDAGTGYEFAVADDGPGIAPQFQDRIFVIFQTLEARDKVENTGVGLALAKKIVESLGGTIWVESSPGAGATFRFTWPHRINRKR